MLCLTMNTGESGDVLLHVPGIDEPIVFALVKVKGRRSAMVGIEAHKSIAIERREVMERRINSAAKIAKAQTLGRLDGDS